MKRMRSAHTYFYVINLINLLAPSGYWFVWVWFKIDPMNNIMPVITTVMDFVSSITTFSSLLTPTLDGDYDESGVVDSADQDYLEAELTTFTDGLTDLMDSFTGIIALFTWPIAAACLLSSFNSLASYWPLALFTSIKKGGKQPRLSMFWGHVKIFHWQYLIVQGGAVALAFLDTTALGSGTFDMTGNGLLFIIMGAVYAVTVIFNFVYFKVEHRLHMTMLAYAAENKYGVDEKYDNGMGEDDMENGDDEWEEFDDAEWSW